MVYVLPGAWTKAAEWNATTAAPEVNATPGLEARVRDRTVEVRSTSAAEPWGAVRLTRGNETVEVAVNVRMPEIHVVPRDLFPSAVHFTIMSWSPLANVRLEAPAGRLVPDRFDALTPGRHHQVTLVGVDEPTNVTIRSNGIVVARSVADPRPPELEVLETAVVSTPLAKCVWVRIANDGERAEQGRLVLADRRLQRAADTVVVAAGGEAVAVLLFPPEASTGTCGVSAGRAPARAFHAPPLCREPGLALDLLFSTVASGREAVVVVENRDLAWRDTGPVRLESGNVTLAEGALLVPPSSVRVLRLPVGNATASARVVAGSWAQNLTVVDAAAWALAPPWFEFEPQWWGHDAWTPEGAPVVAYRNRNATNPVTTAIVALNAYDAWYWTGDDRWRDAFLRNATWLVAAQQELDGLAAWPYDFEHEGIEPPWVSGMAQGMAVAVLARAYAATGNESYLDAMERALPAFFVPVEAGGVRRSVGNGSWYEEYPSWSKHTLNGFLYALLGLADAAEATDSAAAHALVAEGLRGLRAGIASFDRGVWSEYDLSNHIAPAEYQDVHVHQLREAARRLNAADLLPYAERFETQIEGRLVIGPDA